MKHRADSPVHRLISEVPAPPQRRFSDGQLCESAASSARFLKTRSRSESADRSIAAVCESSVAVDCSPVQVSFNMPRTERPSLLRTPHHSSAGFAHPAVDRRVSQQTSRPALLSVAKRPRTRWSNSGGGRRCKWRGDAGLLPMPPITEGGLHQSAPWKESSPLPSDPRRSGRILIHH